MSERFVSTVAAITAELQRQLSQSALDRLRFLMNDDPSPDVRVEAATALSEQGLADAATVAAVVAAAGEQPRSKQSRRRQEISHE